MPVRIKQYCSRILLLTVGAVVMAALFACHAESLAKPNMQTPAPQPPITERHRQLDNPDAVIQSSALISLPQELLRIPLLKALLTEDFLFPYADSEDWLGLKGSLQRIVFEHHLHFGDHVLNLLLQQPATVFLWCDSHGALRNYAITMEHPVLAQLAAAIARVAAAGDTQIRTINSISINGNVRPVYQLTLSPRRTYALIFSKNRISLWSDPDLFSSSTIDPAVVHTLSTWFSAPQGTQPERFAGNPLPPFHSEQTILFSDHFLSQGYSVFFPGIHALRFDDTHGQWRSQALIGSSTLSAQPINTRLWHDAPAHAAFCVLAPGDWAALIKQVPTRNNALVHAAAETLSQHLQPSALSCWYPHTPLYAPLLMVPLKPATDDLIQPLKTVFDWVINVHHVQPVKNGQRTFFPAISVNTEGKAILVQRTVPVVDANNNPTLAVTGDHISFSVDARRVHQAVSVADFVFPAQSDLLSTDAQTLAYVDPAALAQLMRDEIASTIPPESEQKEILEHRIAPRLAAMAHFPRLTVQLSNASLLPGIHWYDLQWRSD